jgi:ABC-type ATPase with predicted acetyltransferase domain
MKFPTQIKIELSSPVHTNFRCQAAANSLDIDVKKKSIHKLQINNVEIPETWNIGLVYGSSGSGKTTSIKQLFGNNIFDSILDEEIPIINQLPDNLTYSECASLLNGIGLNSVPCWIRPVKTLSNGQKARAEAVLLMCQDREIVFIDEWTSVVDRTVAKAMSVCLYKYAKKHNKKIVLLSCHYDILEWLNPDWMIDCNKQEFQLPKSEDFFFKRREELKFDIKKIGRRSWKYFSKYHYLNENLPGGKIYLYGLFHKGDQIGFQCYAGYVPNNPEILHFNRTVVHPDYNGLGLGIKMINETSRLLKQEVRCRIMGKFSSVPVFKAMIKNKKWKFLGQERVMGKIHMKNSRGRESTLRDRGIKVYKFVYIGG